MLDFFPVIFSGLVKALRAEFDGISTSRDESTAPTKFPAVNIVQKQNANYLKTRDANKENHVEVMIQVDIYTNGFKTKITEGEKIRDFVSDYLLSRGFNRITCDVIPNLADMSVYRITMRFKGIVGADGLVYDS